MVLVLRAIAYFKQDKALISILFVMIGASVALNLLYAWPMAILIDTVLATTPKGVWFHELVLAPFGDNRVAQIIGLAAAGMLLRFLQEIVWCSRSMLNTTIRLNGITRVRNELYGKLQDLSLSWHRSRSQGDTIYRLNTDAMGPWGILDTLIGSTAACVTLTAMTFVMLSRSVPLTLAALAITPFLAAANRHFSRTIRAGASEMKRCEADLTVTAQRAMGSVSLIQSFSRQRSEAQRFGQSADSVVDASTRLAWQESLYPLTVQIIFAAGGAIILGYGGFLVYCDQFLQPRPGGVSVGDLMVFMAYLGQLWDPLGWVLGFTTKIQTHAAACARVFEVLDETPTVQDSPHSHFLPLGERKLTFSKVTFGYREDTPVVRDISVRIDSGEMVAFVGPSGTGKSSLLNLLQRFYDPHAGAVALDGHDLRDVKIGDVRKHIALVSQDSPLFPDSIAANIKYGRPNADDSEMITAAREAGAADFIEMLPERYETQVIEGGQNLSGGQRQRLAIARALLSNAPILVLDEPTSALDPEHEQWVLRTLQHLRGRKTIVLVTHRIESVATCDRIYVLSGGSIVEEGIHEDLLARGGYYAAMLRRHSHEDNVHFPLRKVG